MRIYGEVDAKMGFNETWVKLMMTCVTSATYSILINGEPLGDIIPSRGLRQGDPLSPYLFLLHTKGLHGLMKKAGVTSEGYLYAEMDLN